MRRDRKWEEKKVMFINGYQEILAGWKFGTNKKEAERKRGGERVRERERRKSGKKVGERERGYKVMSEEK